MAVIHPTADQNRPMYGLMSGDTEDQVLDGLHERLTLLRDRVKDSPEEGRALLLRLKLFRESPTGELVPNYKNEADPGTAAEAG